MKFLLDTNICIHFLRGNDALLEKFKSVGLLNCAISEITLAELSFGAENSSYPDDNRKLLEISQTNLTFCRYITVSLNTRKKR